MQRKQIGISSNSAQPEWYHLECGRDFALVGLGIADGSISGNAAERDRHVSSLCLEQSGRGCEHEAGLSVRASAQLTDRIPGRH
jgi:hypothetical protein